MVGVIGVGGFLVSKLDVGFSEFFREAIVKVRAVLPAPVYAP